MRNRRIAGPPLERIVLGDFSRQPRYDRIEASRFASAFRPPSALGGPRAPLADRTRGTRNSLRTGKISGKFADFGPSRRFSPAIPVTNRVSWASFLFGTEQRIFSPEQGIDPGEQESGGIRSGCDREAGGEHFDMATFRLEDKSYYNRIIPTKIKAAGENIFAPGASPGPRASRPLFARPPPGRADRDRRIADVGHFVEPAFVVGLRNFAISERALAVGGGCAGSGAQSGG
jgi:hypothetical protein